MQASAVLTAGPGAGTSATVSTATAAVDLGVGRKIWMKASAKVHVVFGQADVGVPATTDLWLTADQDYIFDTDSGKRYFRAIAASGSLTLTWGVVG